MINTREGKIKVEGKKEELLSDVAIIVQCLYSECDMTEDELMSAFEIGLLSEKELDKKLEEIDIELRKLLL